jgi:hypothetical protein
LRGGRGAVILLAMSGLTTSRREALWIVTAAGLGAMGCQDDEGSAPNGGGASGSPGVAGSSSEGGEPGNNTAGAPSGGSKAQAGGGGSAGTTSEAGGGGDPAGPGGAGGAGGSEAGAGGEAGGGVECAEKPQQTLGPFPNKSQLERSDIRSGQAGAALRLRMRVASVFGCLPVPGATVELWQCNAAGDYSEYVDFGTADQNWLRGFQVTDGSGVVEFVTIYPGWYPGRSVHVHIRVKRTGRPDFVSQLYFDDVFSDGVLGQAPYTSHAGTRPRNEQDGIFVGDGGPQLMLDVQSKGSELQASFDVNVPA